MKEETTPVPCPDGREGCAVAHYRVVNMSLAEQVTKLLAGDSPLPLGWRDKVLRDCIMNLIESERPAIEAEAVREFVRRVRGDLEQCKTWTGIKEDELRIGLMTFAKHRVEAVAAEMGISLEGE